MSHSYEPANILTENTRLSASTAAAGLRLSAIVGLAGLGGSVALGFALGDGLKTFLPGYLVAYCFWLSVALGSLFFVMIQHLARAGWSVTVRRMAEMTACTLPLFIVLAAPLVIFAGDLYEWVEPANPRWDALQQVAFPADLRVEGSPSLGTAPMGPGSADGGHAAAAGHGHTHADGAAHTHDHAHTHDPAEHAHHRAQHIELIESKAAWLSLYMGKDVPVPGFAPRIGIALLVLGLIAFALFRKSTAQDVSGDVRLTYRSETLSAPGMILFALMLTVLSFDLLMSLQPTWFSTIFGVYYFAGGVGACMASLIVGGRCLQRLGYIKTCVNTEHYHDLGKLMFAFVVFWGYIGFSQYMLIWYGNLPEETTFYWVRASNADLAWSSGWNAVSIVLWSAHLLIPLVGFMSRHVKRRLFLLTFWAVWMLGAHYLDLWWLVQPVFSPGQVPLAGLPGDLCALVGVGGLVLAAWFWLAGSNRLVPIRDPRIYESVMHVNQ